MVEESFWKTNYKVLIKSVFSSVKSGNSSISKLYRKCHSQLPHSRRTLMMKYFSWSGLHIVFSIRLLHRLSCSWNLWPERIELAASPSIYSIYWYYMVWQRQDNCRSYHLVKETMESVVHGNAGILQNQHYEGFPSWGWEFPWLDQCLLSG